jgi:hypothetical protein
MSSGYDGQVSRVYRFSLTVEVDEDHEAYDDPELIADTAWEALSICDLECTYDGLELVDDANPTLL